MKKKLNHHRSSLWQADIASIVLLVLFVVIVFIYDSRIEPEFTDNALLFAGMILALVPAIIWITFFYRRDIKEPEPKGTVIQVFILGGLLSAAIGVPLINFFFDVPDWIFTNIWVQIFGSILVVGFSQEFLKYAAVRWSVFTSEEFDEPMDGIIYATAAGLGFATVLNITFVLDSGGVDLGTGAIRITITALAHASFAGIVGYFLAMEKFNNRPIWWTAMGLILAATLNGVFFILRNILTQGDIAAYGDPVRRWIGLLLALIFSGVITGLLFAAMNRQDSIPATEDR